ncbi:MAG: carboxypeptidase regulatory-like domain-containing protein [Acidobacteriia bacterium]|nr:carboxypeptidase regulatory-like domain-containing protein [Terriglobia bacterium]
MNDKRTATYFRRLLLRFVLIAASLAISGMMASEFHGTVNSGGLPFPGVTVTATQGDRKVVTTTDEKGLFRFADLTDGIWTVEVQMLGFETIARQVGIAPGAPAPVWELKFLTEDALLASLDATAGPSPSSLPPREADRASGVEPGSAVPPSREPDRASGVQPGSAVPLPKPQTTGRASQSANGSRPSLPQSGGFQRLAVNQSADSGASANEGVLKTDEIADLNQTSANSFIVQGSVSSALGMGQQNDWGGGPPGGPGMMGMGGPGMGGPGMGGPGGDGPAGAQTASRPGGMGGGPGGGGPGGGGPPTGGGPPGGGGPGGPGGGPGGGFGPGGPGGPGGPSGPGRPDWQGRPNSMAFGNGRRDPRTQYMASAFFSLDNSVWDARSFSVTGANLEKPAYANGRGGVTFGGPLRIPKLVSASKRILFTFDLQFQRNRTGTTSDAVNMPTALERSGDFSQILFQGVPVTIYDPATGAPFPGNKIPASRISATSAALLKYFPDPNLPFATRNYQTSWTGLNNTHNLNSRVSNIRIGSKERLNAAVGYQGSSTVSPNLFGFIDSGAGRGINANLAWSRNITAKLTNNLQYSFSRMRQLASPYFANRENVAAELGIAGTSQNGLNWGPPNLSFTNYAGLTDGNYSLNRNQTVSIGDTLLWVHGMHNFTFGADYRRQQFNQLADANGRGSYTFNGSATSLLANGVAQSGTGYDLADFLLGLLATSSIRYGNPDKYFRGSGYDFFVNDDWRIAPRFSLILGVRWDYATPVSELYNRLVNLDVAPGYAAVTAVEPGQTATYSGLLPNALIRPDRNNFSPRLGFAWRPLTKGSLVVRGGYGVYYNTSVYNLVASNMAQQPPFAQSLSVSSSAASPLSIQDGFLSASGQTLLSTYAIDPSYRVGYAQTWTLSVQHDLPLSFFATAGYLGTKGTRLDQQFLPNSVAPGATESSLAHNYIYEASNGNSIYHAAQFQLNRRFHSGIMARASYQFSKSIDNAGTGGRGQGNTPVAQDWLDLSAERGLSSFDARHNLNMQVQYSTGMGMGGGTLVNGWKGALMKDWTITSNISVRSGTPFTATVGGNLSQVNGTAVNNTVRASATGLPVELAGMLFNTAAFTAPLAGEWGTAGRNTIPGPTTFSLDGSLGRVFRFGERRSADLQFQAQNILNRVTITNWGTVLGSSNYGLATNAAGMRRLTINLRFRF